MSSVKRSGNWRKTGPTQKNGWSSTRYKKWVRHRKGPKAGQKWYKKRVWKKTKRMKKVRLKGRYEFHGRGRDLYRAVVKAHRYMPKGFVDVPAERFLEHPEEYGYEGSWIESEVES